MKVRIAHEGGNAYLEFVGESDEDCATVRAFAQATPKGAPLRIRMLGRAGDESVESITIEAPVAPPAPKEELLVGFSARGWADRLTDESQRGWPYQWEHGLEVRPAADPPEPPHGFIARVWVITHRWEKGAEGLRSVWAPIGDPVTVYYGEHASLKAGVAAARKAYERSLLLRDGPKEP